MAASLEIPCCYSVEIVKPSLIQLELCLLTSESSVSFEAGPCADYTCN